MKTKRYFLLFFAAIGIITLLNELKPFTGIEMHVGYAKYFVSLVVVLIAIGVDFSKKRQTAN